MTPTVRVDEVATALGISRAQATEQLAACGIEISPNQYGRPAVMISDVHRLADAHRQARDEVVCPPGDHQKDTPEPYATAATDVARQVITAYLATMPRPAPTTYRCLTCHALPGERCRTAEGRGYGKAHSTRRARATDANQRRLDDTRRAGSIAYTEYLATCEDTPSTELKGTP